jgi:HlyD family secretion protein
MKRIAILIGVLLVAVVVLLGLRAWQLQRQQEVPDEWQEVRVVRGDLVVAVSATGNVSAQRTLNLVFNSPGVVKDVRVERGDVIRRGDLLAQLETDDLELAARQAQAALEAAKASLAQATAPPRDEEIAQTELTIESAEAALAAAQADLAGAEARLAQARAPVSDEDLVIAQLDLEAARVRLSQLQAGPDETAIEIARLSWELGKNSVWQAQLNRDAIQPQPVPDYQKVLANASVGAAEISTRISELQYQQTQEGVSGEDIRLASITVSQALARLAKLQSPISEHDLAVAQAAVDAARARVRTAQAQVSQAELSLALLLAGPRQEQIDALRAQVSQAEVAVEQAQLRLEKARLVAPFDGIVAQVNVKEGEMAVGGVPAAVLVDLTGFHIEIEIDELDVGQVSEGQEVVVTLDALPDVELEGRVEAIAPTAFQGGGVVSYYVNVGLEAADAPVREGMSATVNIVTQRLENVLTVPNRALRLDRDTGKVYVEKLVSGKPREIEIETGFRDEVVSQVIGGLDEGDTVIIRTVSSRERLREAFGPPQ